MPVPALSSAGAAATAASRRACLPLLPSRATAPGGCHSRRCARGRAGVVVARAEPPEAPPSPGSAPRPPTSDADVGISNEGLESEAELKRKQAERLRAAEKFMVIGSGNATCKGCGYEYKPENGDPDFPISKGVTYQALPEDYFCPICGGAKSQFEARATVVAGFAENQKYGLGTNSMTGDQKLTLIYGALGLFFVLFLAGYGLE